jgi:hypothetical protein
LRIADCGLARGTIQARGVKTPLRRKTNGQRPKLHARHSAIRIPQSAFVNLLFTIAPFR